MSAAPEPSVIVWRTSSHSATQGNCVEVAAAPDAVLVRDSKDRDGRVLAFSAAAWHAFLATVVRS